jgi:DNA (cytosine-5)-methyltransferase 3A
MIKVLSLFDGISGARQALKNLNIDCEYYASEIDKYAIQVAKKNHPDITHIGDVKNLICTFDNWLYPKDANEIFVNFDLLIGGSPCQDLSIAKNNRKGLDGERSGLFYEYVRILKECKPKFFILENVASMSKESKELISKELFNIEPILINSSLLTAQQRKRLYWVGKLQQDGSYKKIEISQPEDKGILLKDILETGLPYLEKSQTLTASYGNAQFNNSLAKHQRTMVAEPILYNKYNQRTLKDKSATLTTGCGSIGTIGGMAVISPIRLGHFNNGSQTDRIYSVNGKYVCLGANGGGGGANTGLYKIDLPDGDYTIRKLKTTECARLQGFPDDYCQSISATQTYKCYGNSFTVPVIKHILEYLFL